MAYSFPRSAHSHFLSLYLQWLNQMKLWDNFCLPVAPHACGHLAPLWPPLWPLAGAETTATAPGASAGVSSRAPMAAAALPPEPLVFRTCQQVWAYSASSRASNFLIFLETCSLRSSGSLSRNRCFKRRPAGSPTGRWVRRVCMSWEGSCPPSSRA